MIKETLPQKLVIRRLSWSLIWTTICVSGVIGIALKFMTLLDHWLYFPIFPNILDALFLVISVLYLAYQAHKTKSQA
ncbi:MAG: hypothetical protein NWE83_07310 [Candidatus Bathyarchaeota archaeon]|jgi:hypothetical protein|nr:hypothetical protein [Candidatus Bathyarchaeota archaeon]